MRMKLEFLRVNFEPLSFIVEPRSFIVEPLCFKILVLTLSHLPHLPFTDKLRFYKYPVWVRSLAPQLLINLLRDSDR